MGQPANRNGDSMRHRVKRLLARLPFIRGFVARKRAVEAQCERLASELAGVKIQRDALLDQVRELSVAHAAQIEELQVAQTALAAERDALTEKANQLQLAAAAFRIQRDAALERAKPAPDRPDS